MLNSFYSRNFAPEIGVYFLFPGILFFLAPPYLWAPLFFLCFSFEKGVVGEFKGSGGAFRVTRAPAPGGGSGIWCPQRKRNEHRAGLVWAESVLQHQKNAWAGFTCTGAAHKNFSLVLCRGGLLVPVSPAQHDEARSVEGQCRAPGRGAPCIA